MSTSPTGTGESLPMVDRLALRAHDLIALVGRLALGGMFVNAGFDKLSNVAGFAANLAKRGVPAPSFWGWVGVIVEFGGGLMVVLGVRVRYAALLMILFVIVATAISHRFWELVPPDFAAQRSHFLKNLTIMGGFLFLFLNGGGRLSVDGFMGRNGKR